MPKRPDRRGWVYVLTNAKMPGIVKIGRTGLPLGARLGRHNANLGVCEEMPPFRVAGAVWVSNCVKVEGQVHALLGATRITPSAEMFRVDAETVRAVFESVTGSKGIDPSGWEHHDGRRSRARGYRPLTYGQGYIWLYQRHAALLARQAAGALRWDEVAREMWGHYRPRRPLEEAPVPRWVEDRWRKVCEQVKLNGYDAERWGVAA